MAASLSKTKPRDVVADAGDWPALLSSIIEKRHLVCTEETAESARALLDTSGAICDGKRLPVEVEHSLFESFLEDDYDGALHLTTLYEVQLDGDNGSEGRRGRSTPIGIIFWREVPEEEMREWIDFDQLASICRRREGRGLTGGEDGDRNNESLVPVMQESLRWLEQAVTIPPSTSDDSKVDGAQLFSRKAALDDITHSWVKIELLAVRREYWGQRVGTLLLACAMHHAYQRQNSRAVLHVAGGEENVPAVRLYRRFGFVPVAAGGVFHKPDKNLYVLGNIGQALQSLSWSETFPQLPVSASAE